MAGDDPTAVEPPAAPAQRRAAEVDPFAEAWVVVGPTASGKTAAALALAERFDGEIIGADSLQLYRDVPVATCQPTAEARQRVAHHLVGVLDAEERMSAARYALLARAAASAIRARGKRVLLVGGTGLYVRAALAGLFEGPAADLALRAELESFAQRHGNQTLHDRLAAVDGPSARRLAPNDRRRVVRALEVQALTGVALSEHHRRHQARAGGRGPRWLALDVPRDALYANIDARCASIFAGLRREAKALADRGLDHSAAARALGVAEALQLERQEISADEALARVALATRRYAKRQLTWFRAQPQVRWVPAETSLDPQRLAGQAGWLVQSPSADG